MVCRASRIFCLELEQTCAGSCARKDGKQTRVKFLLWPLVASAAGEMKAGGGTGVGWALPFLVGGLEGLPRSWILEYRARGR